jgi:hypothetical protein
MCVSVLAATGIVFPAGHMPPGKLALVDTYTRMR